MSGKVPLKAYTLACLHTFLSTIPPKHNDLVWCTECKDYRQVGVAPKTHYVVQCVNCKRMRHRDYGDAFVTAETRAVSHSLKYAGHRVKLLKDDELLREFYHPAVPVILDNPPF